MIAEPRPAEPLPSRALTANLDGLYLLLGVEGGPVHVASDWDSSVGAHAAIVSYSERRRLGLLGVDLGMTQYGERSGGRAWLAPVVGVRATLLIGLSAGVAAEWEPFSRGRERTTLPPPRFGAMATAWVFAGVVPYVGVGRFAQTGTVVELGVRLTLPTIRFTRSTLP